MMDKCPKCGYECEPIWKNRRFQLYQKFTRIDELEFWNSELAAALQKNGSIKRSFNKPTYSDDYYNYQFRADGIVVRIAKKLAANPNSMREPSKESGKHTWKNPKSQTKLNENGKGESLKK